MRRVPSVVLFLTLAACGGDKDDTTDTMTTDTSSPTQTATGTATGGTTGTGTGTASAPPIADVSNCSVYREQVNTTEGGAYMRGLWYTYDANGWLVLAEQDLDGDGVAEEVYEQTYDSTGRLIDQLIDYDGDGVPDVRYVITYNANGDRDQVEYDLGNDGTVDSTTTYVYDGTPLLIALEVDFDGDGLADQLTEYLRDSAGDILQETFDAEADGTFESVKDYSRPGLLTGDYYYDWDQTGDGTYNARVEEAFNSLGQLTFSWTDQDIDGVVDSELNLSYYSNGVFQMLTASFFDATLVIPPLLDGYFDYYQQPTYDADGFTLELLEVVDLDRDGSPTGSFDQIFTETWSWTCTP